MGEECNNSMRCFFFCAISTDSCYSCHVVPIHRVLRHPRIVCAFLHSRCHGLRNRHARMVRAPVSDRSSAHGKKKKKKTLLSINLSSLAHILSCNRSLIAPDGKKAIYIPVGWLTSHPGSLVSVYGVLILYQRVIITLAVDWFRSAGGQVAVAANLCQPFAQSAHWANRERREKEF